MKHLLEYMNKKVKVTSTEGEIFEGSVISYECALENETDYDCFGVHTPGEGHYLCLYENEIADIEVLED